MTKKELDRISRSWVGHLATRPDLRAQADAIKSNESFADLINDTVAPNNTVQPEDVPAIKKAVLSLYPPEKQTPGKGESILNAPGQKGRTKQ